MTTEERLQHLAVKINDQPEQIQGLERRYHFELTPEGRYGVFFSGGQVTVETDPTPDEDACTLKMSEAHLGKLLDGNLNPTVAFMTGQLKVDGQPGHALKLHQILKTYSN
ncbi:SCP2 sterol-binding domain-containing protein [Shouchella shacheensis]|uniref:SCP2 sterol-binding domain-containing protein n=1 Tax=Shouchella shacheensis TaxID=1649580 RepID=UPI00074035F8|nr:SCP2 sterol-binding domain-containing protein [Shouchella shacheensis]